MLKKPANTKKVEAQAKVEIKKVGSSLNLDLDLSLPLSLRLTLVSRFTPNGSTSSPSRAKSRDVSRLLRAPRWGRRQLS